MSKSVRIKNPKWTDPDDIKYLSFFGTLIHGLTMEGGTIPATGFELRRRSANDSRMVMNSARPILPVPSKHVALTEGQKRALHAVSFAAEEAKYSVRALPGTAQTIVIDMTKISGDKVPVYARRPE